MKGKTQKDVSDADRQAGPVDNSLQLFEYRHTRYLGVEKAVLIY